LATLFTNQSGELCVTLRGSAEDRVLTTLRRWPHWLRADVERDQEDQTRCTAVTLITTQHHEGTIREILKRGFGLAFPVEGGSQDIAPEPVPIPRRGHKGRGVSRP
jgi:hypothetical protein